MLSIGFNGYLQCVIIPFFSVKYNNFSVSLIQSMVSKQICPTNNMDMHMKPGVVSGQDV